MFKSIPVNLLWNGFYQVRFAILANKNLSCYLLQNEAEIETKKHKLGD